MYSAVPLTVCCWEVGSTARTSAASSVEGGGGGVGVHVWMATTIVAIVARTAAAAPTLVHGLLPPTLVVGLLVLTLVVELLPLTLVVAVARFGSWS